MFRFISPVLASTAHPLCLEVDYVDGGARMDIEMSDPILGVTWRF